GKVALRVHYQAATGSGLVPRKPLTPTASPSNEVPGGEVVPHAGGLHLSVPQPGAVAGRSPDSSTWPGPFLVPATVSAGRPAGPAGPTAAAVPPAFAPPPLEPAAPAPAAAEEEAGPPRVHRRPEVKAFPLPRSAKKGVVPDEVPEDIHAELFQRLELLQQERES